MLYEVITIKAPPPHGQGGVFIETAPVAEGFSAPLPHMGGLAPAITLAVGATNLQFFVRVAHAGLRTSAPVTERGAVESYSGGHFDASLFALDATGAGAVEAAARITSYNVCYTKLLRCIVGGQP